MESTDNLQRCVAAGRLPKVSCPKRRVGGPLDQFGLLRVRQ
jgi:hypothetical protein